MQMESIYSRIHTRFERYNLLFNNKVFNSHLKERTNAMNINICSDGGVMNNIASFGLIVTNDEFIFMTIQQHLPDIYNDSSSHRSEAYGILNAVQLLHLINKYISTFHNNLNHIINVKVWCDNKAVVNTVNKFNKKSQLLKTIIHLTLT
jgi:hypothetical protein